MRTLIDRFRLTDKVAIVTGGGRGIGRGIALALAEAGASVVCAARTQKQIDRVAGEVEELGSRALAVRCDVNEPEQLEHLVQTTMERFGGVEILVNNAGGSLPGLTLATQLKDFEQAFHFNVGSAFLLSKLAIPRMLERPDGGVILNISSAMSHLVDSGFVAYGTAKAGLCHMTRLMACELAPRVRVNALAVGAVETDALGFVLASEELRRKMIELTPMGRLGQVEDVAAAALYLCSPAGGWVTGKVFEIDGGTVASSWPMKIKGY
jgi:7-alpha-hydroxysteroid dehydrogenase